MLLSRRRALLSAVAVVATAGLATACGGGSNDASSSASSASGKVGGAITVLTWRTDLVKDGTFDKYVAAFKQKYPAVTDVKVEGITDYETEVKTRMNTDNYGDVLAIPNSVTKAQLPDFFEPLGDEKQMEQTYNWLSDRSYDGKSYGIPVVGNVQGVVYNTAVFKAAGITDLPTTPADFLTDLGKIKSAEPGTTPLYTNYKDGWPLTAWTSYRGGVSGDADYANELTTNKTPWASTSDMGVIDGLLWDAVSGGLTEADPTTTNWEESKNLIATGKIGVMMLGSWAIPQMQAAATAAGKPTSDIGYMAFPAQKDGKSYAVVGGDYNLAINTHSENKATARAWIDWFNNDSGYSASQVGLSPLKSAAVPDGLRTFMSSVTLLQMDPAPAGKESTLNDIQKAAELSMDTPDYRKTLVDEARSKSTTKEKAFDALNAQWAQGIADVG